MLCVEPDGASGFNSTTGHIFEDPEQGPKLRRVINVHICDRWTYYQKKFNFLIRGKLVSKANGFLSKNPPNSLTSCLTILMLTFFGRTLKNFMLLRTYIK